MGWGQVILLRAVLGGPASAKCLLVLPFVSLAREKAAALEPLAAAAGCDHQLQPSLLRSWPRS